MRPQRARALPLLALLLGGCASAKMSAAESPGYYDGGGEAMPMSADAAYPAEEVAVDGMKMKMESEREISRDEDYAAPPSPTSTSGARGGLATPQRPAPVVGGGGGGGEAKPDTAQPEPKEPEKPVARQIIYTAEMHLMVFKRDEAMKRVEELTLAVGGYIQSMSEGYYVVRVPAPRLREIMSEVGGLGMVTHRSLQARDVTEEYVDLQTRIRVLRETQTQLFDLLKKARTVEEALMVRQALDRVTMELEQALGRLRMLESLIGFSTLTVRIEERGPQNTVPSSNDPFPWVDSLGVEATEWK